MENFMVLALYMLCVLTPDTARVSGSAELFLNNAETQKVNLGFVPKSYTSNPPCTTLIEGDRNCPKKEQIVNIIPIFGIFKIQYKFQGPNDENYNLYVDYVTHRDASFVKFFVKKADAVSQEVKLTTEPVKNEGDLCKPGIVPADICYTVNGKVVTFEGPFKSEKVFKIGQGKNAFTVTFADADEVKTTTTSTTQKEEKTTATSSIASSSKTEVETETTTTSISNQNNISFQLLLFIGYLSLSDRMNVN